MGCPFLKELTDTLISWHRNSLSQWGPELPTLRSFCNNYPLESNKNIHTRMNSGSLSVTLGG